MMHVIPAQEGAAESGYVLASCCSQMEPRLDRDVGCPLHLCVLNMCAELLRADAVRDDDPAFFLLLPYRHHVLRRRGQLLRGLL